MVEHHGVHVLLFSNHDKNVPEHVPDKRVVEAKSSPHNASEVEMYSIGPANILSVLDISKTSSCRVKAYDWAMC